MGALTENLHNVAQRTYITLVVLPASSPSNDLLARVSSPLPADRLARSTACLLDRFRYSAGQTDPAGLHRTGQM